MSREQEPEKIVIALYVCPDGHVNEVVRTATKQLYGNLPQTEFCYETGCTLMAIYRGQYTS